MSGKKQENIGKKMKKEEKIDVAKEKSICDDKRCPFHGNLSVRGRKFKGNVTKIFPKRLTIEIERFVYVPKFERYLKKKSKMHARLPDCLKDQVKIGSYITIAECRPLSKIIHHVVIGVGK